MRIRKNATVVIAAFLACAGFLYLGIAGCTSHSPRPSPPKEATNVHFMEWTAWQSWDYVYRLDAPAEVCERFAIQLMRRQSIRGNNCTIKTNEFTGSFIRSRHFPPRFDVFTVTNGLLITADDWIYAVVDRKRQRLYYYNSH